MPPISEAIATVSVAFQSSGVFPSAGYSAGSLVASVRASWMYWLIPAT